MSRVPAPWQPAVFWAWRLLSSGVHKAAFYLDVYIQTSSFKEAFPSYKRFLDILYHIILLYIYHNTHKPLKRFLHEI